MYPQHSRNTPHVTRNNSTIFKTITSSVDESRQTLALFNKDWETYKRNWQNANGIGGKLGSIFTPANAITKSDIEAIKAYNLQIDACVTSQTAFNRTMLNASPAAQNLVASYNGGKVSAQGMATAQNAAKTSTIGLTIAQTALNAAIGMGIGLLINLVVQGVNKLIHANEEAIEKAEELRNKYEEFKNTNASNVSTLKGLESEFKELSKGVSQYGDNISLTTEQYERYKEIIQQIVGMSPSLAEGYDAENGYIADKNGLLERAIELQEIEYRNELRKITNLQNLKTSMAGYIAEYKDAFEGGWATGDMSATSTRKATDFSNALYQAFNFSERYNDGYSSEDLAREILKSLGIDNIDKEMEKFFNENGYYQPNWFFDEYVDEIANNIDAVTNALSFENVGLDEDEFENRILTVKDCAQAYLDMKDSISMANESIQTDLRYIAEYAEGYDSLSSEQQKFVNEFLKGFNIDDITSRDWFGNLTYDEDKMKSVKRQINDFVEALSQNESTKEALADLYAIPTDEQSIGEFVEQFRKALEIIKAYCEENGIEIPITITNSEEAINELEAQQQRAVDFAKDKFDGYDPTAFFKENSINTQEEIDKWLEIAQAANSAADAEERYVQGSTLDNKIDYSAAVKDLNTLFSTLTDNASLLSSINKEISETGRISAENLSKINKAFPEDKYPEMTEALYEYQLGLISTSELFNVLTDCYNKDRDNYVKALVNKAENNAEVFQKIRKLNASLFETMSKDYKLDIDNWKTLAQAKANIDSQLVKELAGVWTGYYSMQRDAVTGLYGAVNKEYDVYDDSDMLTPEMEADRVKQKEVIDKYNKLIQDLNKATANIVVPDIGKLDWSGLSDFDSSSSSNSSSSSPTHFDWIENKVNNLNDELDSLNDKVNDVYSSWGKRNNALASAIDKTREAIDLQKQAYDRYMQEANSVGLSDTYASLVRNGAIDISTISDESLKEKINEYQNWYEKAQDCLKVQEDLINSLNELNSQKFNNLQSEYDSLTQTMSSQIDIIQKQIDLLEMKGKFANESYYDGMISLSQKQLNTLLSEKEQLQSILNSSDIDKDSQQWNDMFNAILNVDSQIQNMTNNIEEFNNAIRDLDWEIFDYLEQSVSRIASESDYLIKLLENEDLFDENGNINKYGDATIGLHIASFETYKKQSEDYYKEMQELQNQIVNGAGKDVLDRYYEMVDAHQDAILAAQDEKNAILDLIEQGYQAQLDSINELISKKQEALNAEKNLYEYQKKVSEQTKNIAALEKQKTAYENFGDDEEIMSKIQQIKVQLEEAKANLEETEYDKYLSDVQMMFDEFVVEYQEWINERLDNEDALLEEIVTSVNQKGEEIGNTLNDFTSKYGTTMSDTLTSIFGSNAPFTDIISQGFGNVSDKVSGVTSAINNLIQKITDIATEKNSFDSSTVTGGNSSSGSSSSGSSNSDYSSSSSSSSSSSNGSNDYDDIFIYKKYYPQKLYPETSIIDRCKYNNFDASFEARARYYSKMGGSGSYTSSYAQNTWMIKKMKEMGYAKGTDNATKGMRWTQENGEELILRKSDGAILTPLNNGDMVLKHESTKTLYDFANNPQAFLSNMNLPALDLKLPKLPQLVNRNANNTTKVEFGDVSLNFPNVKNYEDFMRQAQKDKRFEKMVQEMTIGQTLGNNTFKKFQF